MSVRELTVRPSPGQLKLRATLAKAVSYQVEIYAQVRKAPLSLQYLPQHYRVVNATQSAGCSPAVYLVKLSPRS